MQLSDLIKSKIDLYGLSFGIGSKNKKRVSMVARKQSAMTEAEGGVSVGNATANARTKRRKATSTEKPSNPTKASNKKGSIKRPKKKINEQLRNKPTNRSIKKIKNRSIQNRSIQNRSIQNRSVKRSKQHTASTRKSIGKRKSNLKSTKLGGKSNKKIKKKKIRIQKEF